METTAKNRGGDCEVVLDGLQGREPENGRAEQKRASPARGQEFTGMETIHVGLRKALIF